MKRKALVTFSTIGANDIACFDIQVRRNISFMAPDVCNNTFIILVQANQLHPKLNLDAVLCDLSTQDSFKSVLADTIAGRLKGGLVS